MLSARLTARRTSILYLRSIRAGVQRMWRRQRAAWGNVCYVSMCCAIAVISFYDALLVFHHRAVILDFERNPVGRLLIEMQHGDVTAFLIAKAAGTLVVVSVLALLRRYCQRYAYPVTGSITAFQFGLLGYLNVM